METVGEQLLTWLCKSCLTLLLKSLTAHKLGGGADQRVFSSPLIRPASLRQFQLLGLVFVAGIFIGPFFVDQFFIDRSFIGLLSLVVAIPN